MNKIRLFIEEQEVELQEEVQVAITKQFEELSNPTVICNTYSKSVKIPMTAKNNLIFGQIYKPDFITVPSSENILDNMTNGVEAYQSSNLLHTNKEKPIYYDHPEIIYPQSRYMSFLPTEPSGITLNSYSVYRGTPNSIIQSYISNSTAIGKQWFEFVYNPTTDTDARGCLTFKFNSTMPDPLTTSEPYVMIDFTGYSAGKYYVSFEVADFTTGSANPSFNIKNILITQWEGLGIATFTPTIDNKIGVHFDPYKKLSFRLEWNSNVLMQGYSKMLSTKMDGDKGYYELTLNGELGKVFQEMQKISFDPAISGESDGKYFIDGSVYVNEKISKELVYSAWTNYQTIEKIDNPNIKFWDIINFAPNNAFNEDFDYKSLEMYDTSVSAYTQFDMPKFLDDRGFKTAVGVDADSVISEGVTPRGMGDFRSYMQQPFIYFNKLFQIFQKKSEELTGYKFNLDSSWFNTSNNLWYRNVVLLNSLNYLKPTNYTNIYTQSATTQFVTHANPSYVYKYVFTGQSGYLTFNNTSGGAREQLPILKSDKKTFGAEQISYIDGTWTFQMTMTANIDLANDPQTIRVRDKFAFVIDIYADYGTSQEKVCRVCVKDQDSTFTPTGTTVTVYANRTPLPVGESTYTVFDSPISFKIPPIIDKESVKFYFKVDGMLYLQPQASFTPFVNQNQMLVYNSLGDINTYYRTTNVDMNVMPLVGKSYSQFTLNDLWNNDYKLFDIILNYCKMYRIFIKVDEVNKTINFIPSHKYFENYEILDWTDKLCTDKEITVKPISWDKKYVSFNYKESETELGKKYKEQYGAEWGEKKITTVYDFNTETNELFSGITPSLTYTPNILGWGELLLNDVSYYLPSEIYVDLADEDNKYVNQFGAFYLMTGLYSFDSSGKLPTVFITDDTELQQKTKTYFYSYYNGKTITTAPRLNVIYSNNMCVFGKPLENYTYLGTAYSNGIDIYNKVWKKYLEERYNRNNKIVTAYIYLTPSEYMKFDFNKFVKIENQLYIVNKIYDYDAVTNQKVKMDLITVQDITGYTTR